MAFIPVLQNEAVMDLIRSFGIDPSNCGDCSIKAEFQFPIAGVADIQLHVWMLMTQDQIRLLQKTAEQWPVHVVANVLNMDRPTDELTKIEFFRPPKGSVKDE